MLSDDRGSVAVVLLVLVVMAVVAGAVVERAVTQSRAARSETERLDARAALDTAVADATARLDLGAEPPFTGSGTQPNGARWWFHVAPVASGARITAGGLAGSALRQQQTVVNRSGSGGWRAGSSREVPASASELTVLSTSGLQAYWRLDEATGPAFADRSGNGLTATVTGTPAFNQAGALGASGDANAAASFGSGVGNVGDRLDFNGRAAYSVAAWIRPAGGGQPHQYPICKDSPDVGPRNGWMMGWTPSTSAAYAVRIAAAGGLSVTSQAAGVATINPGTWGHVVMTYDGTWLRLYVDGSLRDSVSSTISLGDTTVPLRIGGCESFVFSGAVDEPAIWNRALTEAEVRRLHAAGATGRVTAP